MPLQQFFLPKNSFLANELKRGQIKMEIFCLDGVKQKQLKKLPSAERRIEAFDSPVYKGTEAL
jgi:hypothetical protein